MIIKGRKRCPKCNKCKPILEFWINKASSDGLSSYCKKCQNSYRSYKRRNRIGYWEKERKQKRIIPKLKVVTHYSNSTMKCAKCGFSDMRALSVDHIEGNGNKHRKEVKGCRLYQWLIKNKYPKGFQILCMNCQFIKRHENQEWGLK